MGQQHGQTHIKKIALFLTYVWLIFTKGLETFEYLQYTTTTLALQKCVNLLHTLPSWTLSYWHLMTSTNTQSYEEYECDNSMNG